MDKQHHQYINGFNNGYTLAKHDPGLLSKIVKGLRPATGYLEGFFSGKEEYELEHSREQFGNLNNIRNQSQKKDRDLDR